MAGQVLYRRRLVHALDEAKAQVVYVYGPVGFGKTTTARQWSESQEDPTVWVESQSTTHASELLRMFIEAIAKAVPALEEK